jgi:hypothetical protein
VNGHLAAAALAVGLGVLPAPFHELESASAQRQDTLPPGVSVSATAAFEGHYDVGAWLPLYVDLDNGSGQALSLEVSAGPSAGAATFVVPVEMPPGSRKRVPLTVRPEFEAHSIRVSINENGSVLAQRSVPVDPAKGDDLIVLVSDHDGTLTGLDALSRSGSGRIAPIVPTSLPDEALAYSSVDYLVLSDVDTGALTADQAEAIRQWVALGGQLVVVGGAGVGRTLAGLPMALQPATASAPEAMPPDLIQALDLTKPLPPGEIRGAGLSVGSGAKLMIGTETHPVLVGRPYGVGAVAVLAVQPGEGPLESWAGNPALWRRTSVDRPASSWSHAAPSAGVMTSGFGLGGERALPSGGGMALLILGFIVLVGPFNYLVLRRRQRLDLAWLTIPGITLAAAVTTYAAGIALHGTDLVVYQSSVAEVIPEAGLARVNTVVGIFSPTGRTYDATLSSGLAYAIHDVGSSGFRSVEAGTSRAEGVRVDQWSIQYVGAEAIVPWQSASTPAIDPARPELAGAFPNPLASSVEDLSLASSAGTWRIGRAVGASDSVRFDPTTRTTLPTVAAGDDDGQPTREALMWAAFSVDDPYPMSPYPGSYRRYGLPSLPSVGDRPVLLGFNREAPLQLTVSPGIPRLTAVTLVYTDVGGGLDLLPDAPEGRAATPTATTPF